MRDSTLKKLISGFGVAVALVGLAIGIHRQLDQTNLREASRDRVAMQMTRLHSAMRDPLRSR